MTLVGSFAIPHDGLLEAFGDAFGLLVREADGVLSGSMALVGSFAMPNESLLEALADAFAFLVREASDFLVNSIT